MPTNQSYFIDPHMHAFDLSHPNLSAFLFRKDLIQSLISLKLYLGAIGFSLLAPLISPLVAIFPEKIITILVNTILKNNPQIKNTLAFYENSLDYQFLLIDYYLKKPDRVEDILVNEDNTFKFDNKYNKILLCPMAVDFGYKNIDSSGVYYSKAAKKPMGKQLSDLFRAIEKYYQYELIPNANKKELDLKVFIESPEENIDTKPNKAVNLNKSKAAKLFEIYPFMGLNTRHYTLEELEGTAKKPGLLDKYFSEFKNNDSPIERYQKLYDKIGDFDGNMYNTDLSVYKNIFTGIKVYPQLGFKPWPADEIDSITQQNEREKVLYLYKYCISKRIPIITHCSDGGFEVDNFDSITDPGNDWTQVIRNYPDITLCFAHFGNQRSGATKWQNTITNLISSDNNLYTDISCNDSCKKEKKDYYNDLKSIIDKSPHLAGKVLFGSDFSINMLVAGVNSNNQYLKKFIEADLQPYAHKLCNENALKFLFGK